MSTKSMYDLKETLCTDLDQYAKKTTLTGSDLDMVHKITDTIKNISKINMMEEDGYSYGEGNWNANGSYSNGMGASYGRRSGRRGSYDARMYPEYGMTYSGDNDMEYRLRREMTY